MQPLVSVVIPTLGRPSLQEAVASALRQGVDVDVVIVDDSGATDGGVAGRIGGTAPTHPDDRVRVVRTPGRIGAAAARNLGMTECRGDFIALLDDDDVWFDGHLSDALDVLGHRADCDIYAARGLVLDESGQGRVEPAVLVGDRTVADYFFERAAWRSRNRRILTPTLVFRSRLKDHPMEAHRSVNEDTWWLLTAERDRGATLVQSAHIGVLVHTSSARNAQRWTDDLGTWIDDVDHLKPGAAAVESLTLFGRPAVRAGDPRRLLTVSRDVVRRPGGWAWAPVLAVHTAAAAAIGATRPIKRIAGARRSS